MLKEKVSVLNSAINYVEKGWNVLPVKPASKEPMIRFARNGHNSATSSISTIKSWFDIVPELNIGIACQKSGLIVLDIDYRNMDKDSWEIGEQLSCIETMQVETGDGLHLYFTTDELSDVKGKFDNGIDIKYKGYVVAAPSVHPNGTKYEVNGLDPVALPNWIKEKIVR